MVPSMWNTVTGRGLSAPIATTAKSSEPDSPVDTRPSAVSASLIAAAHASNCVSIIGSSVPG